ncbi:hypothetical protein KC217_22900, partial [Mycobacterium tuberculosis]|nr:hypothetical protein [Mycobacterium tuberculosis]
FCYLGDLAPVLTAARHRAAPGGLLAFSVERGAAGVTLGDSLRYRHAPDYIAATLAACGWTDVTQASEVLRSDRGAPVAAIIVT